MAHGDNGRKGDLLYDGKDMLPDEMEHVNESIGAIEQEFQLKLAEAVAVHHHNFEALERAVDALNKQESSPEMLVRAVKMVESFCSRA